MITKQRKPVRVGKMAVVFFFYCEDGGQLILYIILWGWFSFFFLYYSTPVSDKNEGWTDVGELRCLSCVSPRSDVIWPIKKRHLLTSLLSDDCVCVLRVCNCFLAFVTSNTSYKIKMYYSNILTRRPLPENWNESTFDAQRAEVSRAGFPRTVNNIVPLSLFMWLKCRAEKRFFLWCHLHQK